VKKRTGRPKDERPARPVAKPRDEFLLRAFADVKPLAGGPRRVPSVPPPARARFQRPIAPPDIPIGRGHFVVERADEYVSGYRVELGPGVLKALKSSRWQPQSSVDLHGRRTRGVGAELAREIGDRARRGIRRVLVIPGKGLHSERGIGVLAEAVIDALTEGAAAAYVRALSTAPPRLGGSGAICVEIDAGPR
jgi:DNA-nicking Smr family endonuclease